MRRVRGIILTIEVMCQGLLQVSLEPIGIDSDHDAEEGQEGQIDLGGLSWILILLSERTFNN